MIYVSVPDFNDSFERFVFDDASYVLRFTYNYDCGFWSMGFYTEQKKPIITGIKVIPNFPLTAMYLFYPIPRGIFAAYTPDNVDSIGRDDFKNGTAKLVFISAQEMLELNKK